MNELRTLGLGTPGDMRAELNSLVLEGTKTATAGLLAEYEREAEELESVASASPWSTTTAHRSESSR